jgi:hypothetical protein
MKALISGDAVVEIVDQEFEVHESCFWIDCPDNCERGWKYIDGELVEPDPIIQTYKNERERRYPQIVNQLDMLYHDINQGLFGETAKTSSFYTAISAIKAQYPKE